MLIRIQEGENDPQKKIFLIQILCVEGLDFGGQKASPVTRKSFFAIS
jgi:hypothetical protein